MLVVNVVGVDVVVCPVVVPGDVVEIDVTSFAPQIAAFACAAPREDFR